MKSRLLRRWSAPVARFFVLALTVAIAARITSAQSTPYIYTIAGDGVGGYSGDGAQATAANLNFPGAVAVDTSGNLYIVDTGNNAVRKVAAGTGVITTVAGTGIAGYSGDGGPATSAQFNDPSGIAVDSAGNLYITDTFNCVLRKVTSSTGVISTIAGNGTCAFSGDNGPAANAELFGPSGIAIDSQGNLYLCDSGRVREIYAATGTIATVAGGAGGGYAGDGGPATLASLNGAIAVAVDRSGNLYIADEENQVIREVSASTGFISTVAGNATTLPLWGYSGDGGPATSAKLDYPDAVAVDSAGNLYISDSLNGVIREVTASNGVITTFAGKYTSPPCSVPLGDAAPATAASLCDPRGLAVDPSGDLFIVDTSDNRIREVPAAAPPTSVAAAPTFSLSPGNYPGAQTVALADATPGAAIDVTLDGSTPTASSEAYQGPISVTGNVTIRAVAAAPGYLASQPVNATYTITSQPAAVMSTVAGTGTEGFSGVGGPAASAEIGEPMGMALDNAGNLYFADSPNNVVWKLAAKTGTLSIAAGTGTAGFSGDGSAATAAELYSPAGVAFDSSGSLYIADTWNNRIRKVDAATGLISTVAGNGTIQQPLAGNFGDGGPATSAELDQPQAVVLDASGNLYIADTTDGLVRVVSASTGVITTIAGMESLVVNTPVGDGGLGTSAFVPEPNALALDGKGSLYISSPDQGRVRKLNLSTGIITTAVGNGDSFGNSGDGGPATSAEIYPQGLAFDSQGNLYISNWFSDVREVSAATGLITRVAGASYWGYSGDGGSSTMAQLDGPAGLAFDSAGNLYIADELNSRIREVTRPGPAPAPTFSVAAGTYTTAQTVTITDSASGATIYFTTDGSTPTSASTVYTSPITISQSETLQAIAIAPGYTQSTVASAAYTINIVVATPSFTIADSPGTGSVNAGQSAQTTITVTPANGFNQAVTFACGGLPGGATCTFSPATVTPSSGAATTTLTIATTTQSAALAWPAPNAAQKPAGPAGSRKLALAMLFGGGLWLFGRRRRNALSARFQLILLLLLTMTGATLGCGGGNSTLSGGSGAQPQSYPVTITATAGSQTQTATYTLTVQ